MKFARRSTIVFIALVGLLASVVSARARDENRRCTAVGGTVGTNLGVIDPNTTLGTATGDLKGAAAATILSISGGNDGTTVFTVQHHWVTEAGDTIALGVAKATATAVAPGLFAIVSYPLKIVGGTGAFDGATGRLDSIGEVDLNTGRTIFRYTGNVCFARRDE